MKKSKKILAVILALSCMISMAACGSDKKTSASESPVSAKPVITTSSTGKTDSDTENNGQPEAEIKEEEPAPEPTLIEIAASMQDYSHAEGEDAAPMDVADDNILVLVNKTHPVTANYKADDMVKIERCVAGIGTDETHQMRALAADHLNDLLDAAEADGYKIKMRTGYRSYNYQKSLFDSYAANHGIEEANRYSAFPGESEHQTGWCCDVGLDGVSLTGFNNTKEAEWIVDHAHEFGFILRYPKEKEDITGYIYESWHIRYVGAEAAAEIHQRNITLEEYLGVID